MILVAAQLPRVAPSAVAAAVVESWGQLKLRVAPVSCSHGHGHAALLESPALAASSRGRPAPMPRATADFITSGGLVMLHAAALRDVRGLLREFGPGPAGPHAHAGSAHAGAHDGGAACEVSRSVDFGIQSVVPGTEPGGELAWWEEEDGGGGSGGAAAGGDAARAQQPALLRAVCCGGGAGGGPEGRRGGRLRFRSIRIVNVGGKVLQLWNVTGVSGSERLHACLMHAELDCCMQPTCNTNPHPCCFPA